MASLSLFSNDLIGPSCGVTKLVPAQQLTAFTVWHYYHSIDPQLIRKSNPLFATVEHIEAGMLQQAHPEAPAGYFTEQPCWKEQVLRVREQRGISFSSAATAGVAGGIGVLPLPAGDNSSALHTVPVAFTDYAGHNYLLDVHGRKHLVRDDDVMRAHNLKPEYFISGKHHMFDFIPSAGDL